jgi:anti-anti-sigma factor
MKNIGHAGFGESTDEERFARPEPFRVEIRPDRRRVLVVPRGELDLDSVGAVAAEVDELVAGGFDAIVIDLRATSFIDSSGVHLLVESARRGDARITVIDGPPPVSRVFDLAGVRDVLPFEAAP